MMSDKPMDFIEKVKASYQPSGSFIYLGAGLLNGQVLAEAEVTLPLRMMSRHAV